MVGTLIVVVLLAAVFASAIFWELLTGIALLAFIPALVAGQFSVAATCAGLFAICCLRWGLVA